MFRNVRTTSLYVISKTHRNTSSSTKTNPFHEKEIFRLTTLKSESYEGLINIVHRNSFPAEDVRKPMAIGLNVIDLYGEFLPRFLGENISRIFYDVQTRKAMGVIVNRVLNAKESSLPPLSSNYPGAKAILTSLQNLENQSDISSHGSTPGVQILYLGVLEPYRGKGIAKLLVSDTIRSAKENGRAFIQTFAVQPEMSSFFAGLGFKTLSKLRLKEHYVEGSPAFPNASTDDELACIAKFL